MFYVGLVFDTVGTTIMNKIAEGGFKLNYKKDETMSKPIILFYSFEGNTKRIAEFLEEELNIPCKQIKPKKDLSSKGFSKYIWGGSQVIIKKKPELIHLI